MRTKNWLYTIPLRLRSLVRRNRVAAELRDELEYHHEQKVRDYVAPGGSSAEAGDPIRARRYE